MGAVTVKAQPSWRSDLDLWGRTADQSPPVWRAQFNYGVALMEARAYPPAIMQFTRTLRIDDLQGDVLQNISFCRLGMKQHQEAGPFARLALSWNPDYAPAHASLAWVLLLNARAADAAHEAREAVRLGPKDGKHHAILGHCLLQTGQYTEAVAAFRRARDLRPGDAQAYFALVTALERAGRLQEALAECRAIIERWAGTPVAKAAEVRARQIIQRLLPAESGLQSAP